MRRSGCFELLLLVCFVVQSIFLYAAPEETRAQQAGGPVSSQSQADAMVARECRENPILRGAYVLTRPRGENSHEATVIIDQAAAEQQLPVIYDLIDRLPLYPKPTVAAERIFAVPFSQLVDTIRRHGKQNYNDRSGYLSGAFFRFSDVGTIELVLYGRPPRTEEGNSAAEELAIYANSLIAAPQAGNPWSQVKAATGSAILVTPIGLKGVLPMKSTIEALEQVHHDVANDPRLRGVWVDALETYDHPNVYVTADLTDSMRRQYFRSYEVTIWYDAGVASNLLQMPTYPVGTVPSQMVNSSACRCGQPVAWTPAAGLPENLPGGAQVVEDQRSYLANYLARVLPGGFSIVDEHPLPLSQFVEQINFELEGCPAYDGSQLMYAYYGVSPGMTSESYILEAATSGLPIVEIILAGRVAQAEQRAMVLARCQALRDAQPAWQGHLTFAVSQRTDTLPVTTPSTELAEMYFNLGSRQYWRGNFQEAERRFRQAMVEAPDRFHYRYWRVLALLEQGREDLAYEHLLATANRSPKPLVSVRIAGTMERIQGPLRMRLIELEDRAILEAIVERPDCPPAAAAQPPANLTTAKLTTALRGKQ